MNLSSVRPNILLIMTDQHAPGISGFAGDSVVRTQHLDKLASRSVQFSAAVCASPVCTPSRMCLLTGKEPHCCAAWNNHWVIFPEHVTWPQHFADHGYQTSLIGKMHFGGQDQMQGFQHRPYGDLRHGLGHQPDPIELFPVYAGPAGAGITEIPESLLQDVVVTRETLAHLFEHHDQKPKTPWFCCASYSRPHAPFTAPGRYIRRYRNRVQLPDASERPEESEDPFCRRIGRLESGEQLSAEQAIRALEAYYACVDFVDDCIGELLRALDEAGQLDNTIVIYTSDHGEMAGRHGLWGKVVYFDPSICVPLLITGPGIAEGRHLVDHPISLMDLFPTVCSLAGLPIPDGLDGTDMRSLLAEPATAASPRDVAPSSYYGYGVRARGAAGKRPDNESHAAMRLVRDRHWKYVEVEGGEPLLFHLKNDPDERCNVAGRPENAERCREMREALFRNFNWDQIHEQLSEDRVRIADHRSGHKPTTPNQYMLPDGRVFDAEGDLYGARWLHVPPSPGGGIIPQEFG